MEETKSTTQHSDSLEAATPPNGQSSENGTGDITFTDKAWRGWAAAFGAEGVACVNASESGWDGENVWLALAAALLVARKEAKGDAKRKARRVHDLVLSETLGRSLTPEFHYFDDRATWNPTSEAILMLRVLDVFANDPAYWWERELALDVLRELGVDFGGLDLIALGISANAVRDAMMVVMESRFNRAYSQGWKSGTGMSGKVAEASAESNE